MAKSQFAMKAAYQLLQSRIDKEGNPLPKTEWQEVDNAQEIVAKIVSKRSVESAIKLAKKDEQLAQAVFEGEIELSNALRKLQDKQEMQKYDDSKEFDDNITAARIYKSYMVKGAFTKQALAKKLALLESQIQEKKLES